MWHMLSATCTLIIICTDSKQTWAFDQTRNTQPCKIHTWAPVAPTPSLASLMRTGPCAFDPAASPQPRGPSASCLFNSPRSLSSYSPIAQGRLWIQSKSTPGLLFDIKAPLTETVKDKTKQQLTSSCRFALIRSFCSIRCSSKFFFSINCWNPWKVLRFQVAINWFHWLWSWHKTTFLAC